MFIKLSLYIVSTKAVFFYNCKTLYFMFRGTLFIITRPSKESEANNHGSAPDHSQQYTDSSCSS